MSKTWIDDIRAWPSPRPEDDGISLLLEVFSTIPRRFGRIGMTPGVESVIRMPAGNYEQLKCRLPKFEFVDIASDMHAQRMVKSPLEIEKICCICQIVSTAFGALPEYARPMQTESDIARKLKQEILGLGVDAIPYVVTVSGPGGYDNIIMGPTDRVIEQGDLMIIDAGSVFDGYFCDFDRNWAFGTADDATKRAYEAVWDATEAGFATARPGGNYI